MGRLVALGCGTLGVHHRGRVLGRWPKVEAEGRRGQMGQSTYWLGSEMLVVAAGTGYIMGSDDIRG